MSYYCVKCGKEIKESLLGNGLFCRDCSTDIMLLTNDPRVISGYRAAAGKTVSGNRDSLIVEQRDQAVKPRNNDRGDENDCSVSLSTGEQASDIPSAAQKKNRSKRIIIAELIVLVSGIVAIVSPYLFYLDGVTPVILFLILLVPIVVIFIIGNSLVNKKNKSKGNKTKRIIIAALVVLFAEVIATVFIIIEDSFSGYGMSLDDFIPTIPIMLVFAIFIIGIDAQKKNKSKRIIFAAVSVLVADVITTVLGFIGGNLFFIYALISAAFVIFLIGLSAKKTNESLGIIIIAVCDLFPAIGLVFILFICLVDINWEAYTIVKFALLALSVLTQIAVYVVFIKSRKKQNIAIQDAEIVATAGEEMNR